MIDLIVFGILLLYVLNGIYRGFLPSLLNLGGFLVSWLVAFITYPLLSKSLVKSNLFQSIQFYFEGIEHVNDYENARLAVSSLSKSDVSSIMEKASMPKPFNKAITSNIERQVFAKDGLVTVGEYFDKTITNIVVHIISFLIIFIILRVLFTLFTNAFSYSMELPQLQRFDGPMGGLVALVRGFFSMQIAFMVVSIALMFFAEQVASILNNSLATTLFYSGNAILPFISGKL